MTTPPETNPAAAPEHDGPISQVQDEGRFGENRADDPYEPGRKASYAFRTAVGVFVLALFLGAWWIGRDNRAEHKRAQDGPTATATGPAQPRRVFFPGAQTQSTAQLIDPQAKAAAALLAGWWQTHGTTADDKAFVTWLAGALPGPAGDRNAELAQVKAAVQTQDGDRSPYLPAARWLSKQGLGMTPAQPGAPAPIWGQETAAQAILYDPTTTTERSTWASDAVTLATQISAKVSKKDQLSAPYVTDPSLAPGLKIVKKGACPCSYPAPHAAVAAAARTLLGGLQPPSDPEYAWMQQQIAYASLFLGHAYPSDIAGGTLLGDAVGEYVLVTRAHQKVPPAAAQ